MFKLFLNLKFESIFPTKVVIYEVRKNYDTTIVIGEDTYRTVKDKFKFHKLDDVQVKGKSNKVAIYSIK